ncbi:tRNA (cytidine(34)-2'-O)-methyltransferase [Caminibacter mediatlanticus TB-2]|uniref:Putative tRNA (cytidine(34)-2'-O)-methyltransferase n=1 Tax=Caminibacter mediatlanticus TB-2 TaxID=391592 RepID=A0AAI9AHV1_9BACT|nr:tRNA (cytidine(34)-2'-O)-methyltransferase [Caminibacter mediatlanticus]EDM23923.1 tRNA/rRNA methyltransferase (SpoU) [Caminibacter mediatlanticus TB-2]QCT94288.1 tRNA (cytidine(34)-2'-O)-methyltransferase [Caminibacter mediatlanticus TB-2]
MFNIVLFNPQIPPNTGNIGRLCVNAGAKLHIVKPIGFDISQKAVKRAGLDYWDKLDLKVWESVEEFLKNVDTNRCFFATTKTKTPYFEKKYKKGDYFIFGSETKGIDEKILNQYKENNITIPMTNEGRSLNLAVSCGIILYEAIRQNFKDFSW